MGDTDATQARQNVVAEVDEIIEHVINANMLSMPYDVYSELFDAVDGLGVEIENLQAENANLREESSKYNDLYVHAIADAEVWHLQWSAEHQENAKLRELVLCLLTCSSDSGDACDKCPVNGGAGIWDFEDFCDSLLDHVRELGVEVG